LKINVQLFGGIGRKIPNYDHSVGLDLEVADDAVVVDILRLVNAPDIKLAVTLRDGEILKREDRIYPGDKIVVLESFSGG
jgi:sulfur carrier protein ThiS